MASFARVCTYNKPVPVLTTSLCKCSCRVSTKKTLNLPPFSDYSSLSVVRDAKTKPLFRSRLGRISVERRFLTAVTRAESNQLGDDNSEVNNNFICSQESILDIKIQFLSLVYEIEGSHFV